MKARTAWLAAAAGAAAAVYHRARRRHAAEDPRAEELRQKLEESRAVVEEQHEEAASPDTPVDAVSEPSGEVDDRRRAVHQRARAATEEMRGPAPDE